MHENLRDKARYGRRDVPQSDADSRRADRVDGPGRPIWATDKSDIAIVMLAVDLGLNASSRSRDRDGPVRLAGEFVGTWAQISRARGLGLGPLAVIDVGLSRRAEALPSVSAGPGTWSRRCLAA